MSTRRRRRRFVIFVLTSFLRRAPSRINPSRTQHQQSMNAIANVGRASKDVVAMSKEMFKMGIIEDVLEDTLATSTHFSNTEEDEETDAEVDAILKEIAGEVRVTLPNPSVAVAKTSKATVEADATSSLSTPPRKRIMLNQQKSSRKEETTPGASSTRILLATCKVG